MSEICFWELTLFHLENIYLWIHILEERAPTPKTKFKVVLSWFLSNFHHKNFFLMENDLHAADPPSPSEKLIRLLENMEHQA